MHDSIESKIRDFFTSVPHVAAIYLFGSSDIDLAVLFESNHSPAPLDLIQLKDKLSDTLEHDVDLVGLKPKQKMIHI